MRLSLSTNWNSHRHETADAMLEEIVALGFDTVELGYALSQTQADGLESWIASGRIHVSSVHAYCPVSMYGRSGPEVFSICDPRDHSGSRRGMAAVKSTADFAASVGARAVVLHAGRTPIHRHIRKLASLVDDEKLGTPHYAHQLDRVIRKREHTAKRPFDILCEALNELLPYFEKLGLTLGLENLPTYDAIPNEPEMALLLDAFQTPAFGYWHDTGHGQIRENLGFTHHAGVVTRFSERIAGLHLHDVTPPVSDHHMPPGGMVDFSIFSGLIDSGIPFVLEPSRGSDASSIKTAVRFLSKLWGLEHDTPGNKPADSTPADRLKD